MKKLYIVVFLIAFGTKANSQYSIELNAGTERAAACARFFNYVDKSKRWSLYSSNQLTINYDKCNHESCRPGFFSANIVAYNFRNGIGLSTVLIVGDKKFHSSTGIQYQKTIRSFYFYFLSTYELQKFTKQENYLILLFKRNLSKRVKFILNNENYICFQKWDYDQSLQRIKSGLEIRHTQIGFLSETSQSDKSHQIPRVNFGFFIKQSF